MVFQGKFPRSRRQAWNETSSKPQYSLAAAGAPLSRKVVKPTTNNSNTNITISPLGGGDRDGLVVSSKAVVDNSSIKIEFARPIGTDDDVDTPGKLSFSKFDIFSICISIILYVGDIGLDCFVAYKHYLHVEKTPLYFGFTVVFILLSSVITSVFSLWWYYFEYHSRKEKTPKDLPSTRGVILRVVACIMNLGPVVRYVDTITYGLKSRRKGVTSEQRQYFHKQMQFERVDGAMLRLFEAFLESAPQFLLQVFIILREGFDGEKEGNYFLVVMTIVSITSSVLSLAWSVVAYHKALRLSRHDLNDISHVGLFFRFLWRMFEISPRVISLALFMSAYEFYVGIFAGAHWLLMMGWLFSFRTNFCEKSRGEIFFVITMALVWSFCFFNLKDGRTRRTMLLYYILYYIENVIMTTMWYFATEDQHMWFRPIIIAVVLGSIVPMLACMLIYYTCFHEKRIPYCLPLRGYWLSCDNNQESVHPSRYSSGDGNKGERKGLTTRRSPTPPSPPPANERVTSSTFVDQRVSTAENDYGDEDSSEMNLDSIGLSSMPQYPAPVPRLPSHLENEDDEEGTKPNLSDFVEVDGYLEAKCLTKTALSSPKLNRTDTMPKYTAPRPTAAYGSTVPGGPPANYNVVAKTPPNPLHGSTLPGAAPKAFLLTNDQTLPLEEHAYANTPHVNPRHLLGPSTGKSARDRPPVPLPRLSAIHSIDSLSPSDTLEINQSQLTEESDFTVVSELGADDSSFLHNTMTNPNGISYGLSKSSLDDSINTDTPTAGDESLRRQALLNSTLPNDTTISSIDTPMKDRQGAGENSQLDLSIDTPVKEARMARSTRLT